MKRLGRAVLHGLIGLVLGIGFAVVGWVVACEPLAGPFNGCDRAGNRDLFVLLGTLLAPPGFAAAGAWFGWTGRSVFDLWRD